MTSKGFPILDFGSGEGITADHYAENNSVTAVEPSEEMLSSAWKDHEYKQIIGDVSVLSEYDDHKRLREATLAFAAFSVI